MKIYTFLYLIVIVTSWLPAQIANPESTRRKHLEIINHQVEKSISSDISRIIRNEKLSVSGNITVENISQNWDGSAWENSIKLIYSYDSKDRLFEEINQYWEASSWKNQNKYLFNYAMNDSLSEKISKYWDGSDWENYERLYFLFDINSNIIEQGSQSWETNSWTNQDRLLFTYDVNNNKTEELSQYWFVNSWTNQDRKVFTYDINNNLTEVLEQTWNNSAWGNFRRKTSSYNPDNTLSEEIEQSWTNNSWLNTKKYNYVYPSGLSYELTQQFWNTSLTQWINDYKSTFTSNSNNYLIEILNQDWNGNSFENQFLTSFSYDFSNNKTEWVEQFWNNSTWHNQFRASFSYNTNNQLVEEILQDGEGLNWINTSKTNFFYDNNNLLTELIEQSWDGFGWINSYRELFSYSPSIVSTTIIMNVSAGSQIIQVSSTNGFSIGDPIIINPGGITEETNTITGFGSILLQTPLQFDHLSGEQVVIIITSAVEEIFEPIAEDYFLQQNYPNPFNPSTTIKFQIPEMGFISLKIYDILGNEITTLVNEELQSGSYEATFNAAEFSSGIYFYSLTAGSFIETKKMMLLK